MVNRLLLPDLSRFCLGYKASITCYLLRFYTRRSIVTVGTTQLFVYPENPWFLDAALVACLLIPVRVQLLQRGICLRLVSCRRAQLPVSFISIPVGRSGYWHWSQHPVVHIGKLQQRGICPRFVSCYRVQLRISSISIPVTATMIAIVIVSIVSTPVTVVDIVRGCVSNLHSSPLFSWFTATTTNSVVLLIHKVCLHTHRATWIHATLLLDAHRQCNQCFQGSTNWCHVYCW